MSDDDSTTSAAILELLAPGQGGFNDALGIRFTHASPDEVRAELALRPEHLQVYGIVHGGVYASLVETLCSVGAAISAGARGHSVVGLENHTSFLRAARGGLLQARAVPLTRGRRTQVWETTITDEAGKVAARGTVRLLVLEPGSELAGESVARTGD